MNIYIFELKAQLKSAIMWAACIAVSIFVFLFLVYPVFYDSLDSVMAMINGFPPEFAAAFGVSMLSAFNIGGFYSFSFMYMGLIGAIMAASIGISVFAREKRTGCVDFLLTKPVSREKIFMVKLSASLTILAIFNILYAAISIAAFAKYDYSDMSNAFLASMSMLFTQLVFFALGVVYTFLAKKIRSVSGVATGIGFAAFIMSMLVNVTQEQAFRYIAPLRYFDPSDVFFNGQFEVKYVASAIVVVLLSLAFAFFKFCKSDAHTA